MSFVGFFAHVLSGLMPLTTPTLRLCTFDEFSVLDVAYAGRRQPRDMHLSAPCNHPAPHGLGHASTLIKELRYAAERTA